MTLEVYIRPSAASPDSHIVTLYDKETKWSQDFPNAFTREEMRVIANKFNDGSQVPKTTTLNVYIRPRYGASQGWHVTFYDERWHEGVYLMLDDKEMTIIADAFREFMAK